MQIYLPVADMTVHLGVVLALGGGVGLISGLFGVGGGFLLTPLLLMTGVPPAVAVASQAPQIVASAFSAGLAYLRRGCVDFQIGGLLLAGGLVGSWIGVRIFAHLQALGQIEFVISALYVLLLSGIGALMAYESLWALRRNGAAKRAEPEPTRPPPLWFAKLPLRVHFHHSGETFSVLPAVAVGFLIGLLGAIMGVGGGFIMVPAMIYLLGLNTPTAVGTSLLQVTLIMSAATLLHAVETRSVDAILAVLLLAGGVVGAQIGAFISVGLHGAQLRLLLALLVLGVGGALAGVMVVEPSEPYSLAPAALTKGDGL